MLTFKIVLVGVISRQGRKLDESFEASAIFGMNCGGGCRHGHTYSNERDTLKNTQRSTSSHRGPWVAQERGDVISTVVQCTTGCKVLYISGREASEFISRAVNVPPT